MLGCVADWINLMAAGDYVAAVDFLVPHPDLMVHDEGWTAESLELWVSNYGLAEPLGDGRHIRVTPVDTAPGDPYLREVDRDGLYPPHDLFIIPLNGEWSDLIAELDLVEVDDRWAFALQQLHVP